MAPNVPQVSDGVVHVPEAVGGPEIVVGSPSWIVWLTDPTTRSFSYQSPDGTYTARKERRARGGEYWAAYRRQSGRLQKAYLGKAEGLTLARLDRAVAALSGHGDEAMPSAPPVASSGDGESGRTDATVTEDPTTANDYVRERPHRGMHSDPLLLTKLSVPFVRPSLVARPGLSEKLDERLGRKLTLLSAPAGFGKTTLLSTWMGELSDEGRPIAWLSLDPGDNDPARFWRYLVTAMDRLKPGSGETALALLGSPQAPPVEAILTLVLNDLGDLLADAVLVLDDYHVIESRTIHETLTFLFEHFPPRMHLVIATRADPPLPLSRLRARGELNELRASDLRFVAEEAATFLGQVMGLQISAEEIVELEERTEGWVAGLQLAALAMREHDDVPGFISAFTGSNRHVVDYLAEEVLDRQPGVLRAFLLETSILDRMCAPLCRAVTGHTDGQTTLERLEHANLFVIPLDDERRWYRYHHLFADVLRRRLHQLHPDLVPARHRHASAWFEEEGFLTEAIRHALAAQDWGRAVRLIEASGMAVVLGKQVQTMLGWIDEIPEELVLERPALCTIHAIALAYSNRLDAAETRVQEAERYLRGSPTTDETRAILGRIAVIRSTMARYPGDLERCVAMARRALELLPETKATARERVAARVNATFAYQVSGDVTPSNEHLLEEAVASSRAVGDQIPLLRSINFLARLRTLQGRLRMAAATYEEAAEVVPGREGLRDVVNSAAYYVGLGDIHREWNDLDSAETHLRRGLDLVAGALMVDADVVTHGHLSLARLQQARGRYADARAVLEQFADLARRRHYSPILAARGEAAQARLALMRDDLPAAIVWAEATGLDAEGEPAYPREEEYLTLVRVLISQGRLAPMGSYLDDALGLLDRLFGAAEDGARMGSVTEILTLRALALQARHESGGALAALESALVLAQPEGYVRVFVDEGAPMAALLSELLKARSRGPRDARRRVLLGHARWLLAAFESPRTSTDPPVPGGFAQDQDQPLLDPLTSREQEVLALIAEGLSNREIAARLFIEVGTVKGYVHSLLRKLGVENRTKAVARARDLRLVAG